MKPVIVPFFIAHQGCPHQCVFCNQVKISGAAEAIPTPDEIRLKSMPTVLLPAGRNLEAAFFGGDLHQFAPICSEATSYASSASSPWGRARGQCGFPPAPMQLTRVGGIPHGDGGADRRTWHPVHGRLGPRPRRPRPYRPRLRIACRLLREAGFRVGAQLMPGLAGDTAVTALLTLRRTLALRPDFLRIYPTLVLAGTTLETITDARNTCRWSFRPQSGSARSCCTRP